MILVHRLKGDQVFINADLIESIEAHPDTVLTLIDGRKTVVAEAPEEVVDRIRVFRAAVLATVEELRGVGGEDRGGELVLLKRDEDDA